VLPVLAGGLKRGCGACKNGQSSTGRRRPHVQCHDSRRSAVSPTPSTGSTVPVASQGAESPISAVTRTLDFTSTRHQVAHSLRHVVVASEPTLQLGDKDQTATVMTSSYDSVIV
jgi:hypothetical protein